MVSKFWYCNEDLFVITEILDSDGTDRAICNKEPLCFLVNEVFGRKV